MNLKKCNVLQTQVAVDQLWSDEEEVTSVGPGENVKIKLKVSSIFFNMEFCNHKKIN